MEFHQRVIAELGGFNKASVSRFVASNNVPTTSIGNKSKKYSVENTRKILRALSPFSRRRVKNQVQVFYNFKGGTGKTTLCYQVATHLSLMGYNVLAIDLDPQGHLSMSMMGEQSVDRYTVFDVLAHGRDLKEVIVKVFDGMDLIPGNLSLTRLEANLMQKTRREEILKKTISSVLDDYDFILIDTNPTISTLNLNALFAADHVNVICETQPLSLAGLGLLVEELKSFGEDIGRPIPYHIVANKYEVKTASSQEVLGALRSDYKEHMFQCVVRKSEDINVASKNRLPLCAFSSKRSLGFEDILDLVHEFLDMSTTESGDLLGVRSENNGGMSYED